MWENSITYTVEGALLIAKSAVNNTVCQHVNVKVYNKEIYKMMKILEDRMMLNAFVSMVTGITTAITNYRKHCEG